MDDSVPGLEWTVEPGDRSILVHVSPVVIVDGTEIVRRIMEVTGLEQLLALYPTVEKAQSA